MTLIVFKKPIILFLFLLIAIQVYPQNDTERIADSLLNALNKQTEVPAKALTLEQLFNLYIYTDTRAAQQYAEEIITISSKPVYGEGLVIGNFYKANSYFTRQQTDTAIYYYDKTLELAKKFNTNTMVASSMANISVIEGQRGNYSRAISIMDSVAKINLIENDYLNYGVTLNNQAYHYYELGDYLNAMRGFQKALSVLDTINRDLFRKADVLRNIGKVNYQEADYQEAISYYLRAYEVYKTENDNLYQAYVLVDIGNAYLNNKEYENSITYFKNSYELSQKNGFTDNTVYALGGLGNAYRELKKYDLALNKFKQFMNLIDFDISANNRIVGLYQIGYTYSLLGNTSRAIEYLNRSVSLSDSLKAANELKNALNYRSIVLEKTGNYKDALEDKKRLQKLKDSVFTIEKTKEIKRLQTVYETKEKEAALALQAEEINTLNEKAKVDNLTKGLYAGGMASALGLSGLLIFGFRQRIKKNRIAREKKEELYRKEIEHKKKELASQTLHLVQKNTFIQELKENLENLKNDPERFKIEFRRIVMLLKKENASDKDWEVFKSYFAEVHNDFDKTLKSLYSDISEKEIRLAAFLRMNLTTKEIAATLNVLPDSILKSKYRLKKKLGLTKEQDLNRYLSNL